MKEKKTINFFREGKIMKKLKYISLVISIINLFLIFLMNIFFALILVRFNHYSNYYYHSDKYDNLIINLFLFFDMIIAFLAIVILFINIIPFDNSKIKYKILSILK